MGEGLKYCIHCLEAIHLSETVCVHCGGKLKKTTAGKTVSTMLLLGLVLPACQKPTEPVNVEVEQVENTTETTDKEDVETLQPFIPEGTVKALYGVESLEKKEIRHSITLSIDVEGEKSETQERLEQLLQEHKEALDACYNQGWRPGVSYPSVLKISITQENGKIASVTLREEQSSKLGECLQKEIKSWELPSDTSGPINIILTM